VKDLEYDLLVKPDRLGLSEKNIKEIKQIFNSVSGIEKVWVYGSRARGDYNSGSDIDFLIQGDRKKSTMILDLFDLSSLPYFVDVNFTDHISEAFSSRIDGDLVLIYSRDI
jgi:predicted nucleotidyltransferase